MSGDDRPPNGPTPKAEAARAARLAREAAALRDNLRRRKQQKPPAQLTKPGKPAKPPGG